jgi:hypothetical protein
MEKPAFTLGVEEEFRSSIRNARAALARRRSSTGKLVLKDWSPGCISRSSRARALQNIG